LIVLSVEVSSGRLRQMSIETEMPADEAKEQKKQKKKE
jgi:hypothetical protein